MNSRIVRRKKNWVHDLLIHFHQTQAHNARVGVIGTILAKIILEKFNNSDKIRCLDFGCGDMKVSNCISKEVPNSDWIGTDIYGFPDTINPPFKYIKFDGKVLSFEDKTFDIVILCDVLHHIPTIDRNRVVRECTRVGRMVIVKDHFERGRFSRWVLRAMDFFGNWAYGVKSPGDYFSKRTFFEFCYDNSVSAELKTSQIELYNHLPRIFRYILTPDLHFIAVLSSQENRDLSQPSEIPCQ